MIIFSYDGKDFVGFQKQKKGRSVQEEIEKVLTKINKEEINIRASGRTDTKVHAINQVACFNSVVNMNEQQYKKALNSSLPKDIYVKEVKLVNEDFDPRHDAIKKTYIYKINLGEFDVFNKDYIYQLNHDLDLEKIRNSMKLFIGKHDFKNYCSNDEMYTYIREIFDFTFVKENDIITFKITGNGFMRYMVRYIIGVLIKIGENKIDSSFIKKTLDTNERSIISYKANPEGLYLESVEYGK